MDYFTKTEKITLTIEIIIYSFLVSFIFMFIKRIKKEFNSAFYRLLLVIFITHFSMWFFVTILVVKCWRFGLWRNIYLNNQWIAAVGFTAAAYFDNVIYTGQTLIAFNRFTCLWFPLHQKRIWKQKWYLYLTVLFPILCVCYRFHAEGFMRVNPDGTVQGGNVDKQLEAFGVIVTAFTLGINSCLSLLFNILTVYKLKKESQANMIQADKSVELIIYSIILTIIQCIRFAYNRMRAIFIFNSEVIFVIVTVYSYINAVHTIAASIGILLLSRMTRETFLNFYVFPILPRSLNWKKYFKPSQSTQIVPLKMY